MTQKELLTQHRLGLDNKFKEKFPQGKFVYRIHTCLFFHHEKIYYILWRPRRDTSHVAYKGIGYTLENGTIRSNPYNDHCMASAPKNIIKTFTSLDQMVSNIPDSFPKELVDKFIQDYLQNHSRFKRV